MRITIERQTEDGLNMRRWVFWYYDVGHKLYLDEYAYFERQSRKYRFEMERVYRRLNKGYTNLFAADVEIPDHVKEEAIRQFTESLTVEKWSK